MPKCHRFNMEAGVGFSVGPILPKRRASVPGSVHDEMEKAGLVDPVYYETNHLKCEWIENKCWAYERTVSLDPESRSRRIRLVCEGLNFEARIYWNGRLLGVHKNVHTPAEFDLTGMAEAENTLTILLEEIPRADGQMGRSSTNRYQCERFAYGWDFCTALIGVGIWKRVGLYVYDSCLLGDPAVLTDFEDGLGRIRIEGDGYPVDKALELDVCVKDGESVLYQGRQAFTGGFAQTVTVQEPKLWYPNGYGAQPLYTVELALYDGGVLQDSRSYRVGIRRLEFVQNEDSAPDALPYTVQINGKKIWLKAAVLLPIDQRLGHISDGDYDRYTAMLQNANVNMIRLWGGGVSEKSRLFDRCDERGILVWQDFTQSNGGLDGVPSQEPEFLDELEKSAVYILKQNRSHTCQTVYIAGNELRRDYSVNRRPVTADNPNVQMLHRLVQQYDPTRVFHPSSPSGPNFDILFDEETRRLKRNHNVHGVWSYLGKAGHYEYYNKTDYLYQGEFGVNGASDEETLRRIFSEETLAHYRCPDVHWQLRNSSWWDSFPRDAEVFGEENLATPEAFVAASQLVQAEGLRYTIERNRARAFQCSGNCIWQFNEPFPNPNCTNLVDFFGLPKMAYSWVQKAFAVTTPLLRYERLFYRPGETADFVLAVSHFGPCAPASVTVRLRTPQKVLAVREYEVALKENHCTPVDEWHLPVEESFGPLFFLEVSVAVNGASAAKNLYSFGTDERAPYAPFFEGGSDLRLSCEYRAGAKRIRMANEGKEPCYFVSALPAARQAGVLTENNFVTVFPGEEETVIVACKPDEPVSIKDFTRKIHQTI